MSNKKDERFMAAADEQASRNDPLNPAIAAALADQALPPLPEDSDASCDLTETDRLALASLGTSAEFMGQLISSCEGATTNLASDQSTRHANRDMTIPLPGSSFWRSIESTELDKLMTRLDEVESTGQIRWTSCYRKLQELGRGGQGVVYLTECLDELSGEQALKVYSPQPYGSVAGYHEDMRRLLEVSSAVHRINHDNLVDVQRFVDYRGIYVMVMHWIDGFNLRQLLDVTLLEKLRQCLDPQRWASLTDVVYANPSPGQLCLQPAQAVNIAEKCLRALSALHEKGIVHGDIKPSNIMLDRNGSIRLIDIGSACPFKSPPRERIWTPRYAPPEFLERGKWTPQSDLASLGYVLVELLSGRPDMVDPRVGVNSTRTTDRQRDSTLLAAKRDLPERLTSLLPEKVRRSNGLIRLCQKLIDPDPKKRFADANDAMCGDNDGTWHFRKQLIQGDLGVHEVSEIKLWVEDAKKVMP